MTFGLRAFDLTQTDAAFGTAIAFALVLVYCCFLVDEIGFNDFVT